MTCSHFCFVTCLSVVLELHARRVQHVAFQDDVNSPDIIKERFLETELIMQLEALKQEMPESYLFPEEDPFDSDIDTIESIDSFLPEYSQEEVDIRAATTTSGTVVEKKKPSLLKGLANEGVLETIAMCIFIAFVILSPDSI